MKLKLKKIIVILLLLVFSTSQTNSYALYIHSAKSRSQLADENLSNTLLPAPRYDRNNIKLNKKTSIDILLEKDAKFVTVEITGAEGIGFGIDSNTLLEKGLKIIKTNSLRTNSENKETETKKNKVGFNLKKIQNQSLIIEAVDFKIFKVFLKALLPGSYTLRITVDGNKETMAIVRTLPEFNLDIVSPSFIIPGAETILTFIGSGFNSLVDVVIGGTDIEVREVESLNDETLKVKAFVKEEASGGGRDVTISNPLTGQSVTLVNGLLVFDESLGLDDLAIMDGMDGMDGTDGMDGINGVSICNDFGAMLMIITNTIPAGLNATTDFDPVLCNLIFGIPVGKDGINATGATGNTGATGVSGSNSLVKSTNEPSGANCANGGKKVESGVDTNNNNVLDAGEVTATNYVCNGQDGAIPTVEEVIASWSTYSAEQTYTTASGDTTRMVKIPRFIHDGLIYGGFWVDKYEAARANATATEEGTSSVPIGKRNVVPWTGIDYTTAKTNASASGRQITGLGSCHLIDMKEWHTLYLLGRFAKTKDIFGATATNGWNERGNTRTGKDGRNDGTKICSDDPIESGGSAGRCLTGTGFKSWGHLLDGSSTKDPDGSTLSGAGTADNTANGTDAFDGDTQVYDLTGNVVEWINYTITKSGSDFTVDTGFQGATFNLPFTTNNRYFDFDDVAGNTNTTTNSDEIEFRGLGVPYKGSSSNVSEANGAINDGIFKRGSTDQQYGTARGGDWTTTSDSRSPIYLDFSTATTTSNSQRGFRVTCEFPQ